MNRDEIVRLWDEANNWGIPIRSGLVDELERFANLVAAAKQEQLARQWDALHEQYMADPLRRQMPLDYETVANLIRGYSK